MKSLEELAEIRDKKLNEVELRKKDADRKLIIVGMGTGGIAAGARTVLQEIVRAVADRQLGDIAVEQSASVEAQGKDPVVEVLLPGQSAITYVNVTPEMIPEIITETVENGRVISTYTAG